MRHPGFILAVVCFLLIWGNGRSGAQALERLNPKTLDLFDEAKRTFDSAYFMSEINGEFIEGRMSDELIQRNFTSLEKKRPTIIFSHGCTGLGHGNLRYMRLLAEAGYAVIAPDSFARRYRPETCDPSWRRGIKGAPHRLVNRMRQEEIHHAAYRVRRIRWVDKKNLFLMGHSQGGTAAAAYEGDDFKAHVISGSVCWRGLRSPRGTPILALYSADDPWRRNRPADSCLRKARARGVNMEFHLFEGRAHNLSRNKMARRQILDFLGRHRSTE